MYTVINAFTDLQDGNTVYHTGELYPRKGASVTDERIAELSTSANRLGYPLIAEVHELNPDGEPAIESYEKPASRASSSQGSVTPAKPKQAARTRKKAPQKGDTK